MIFLLHAFPLDHNFFQTPEGLGLRGAVSHGFDKFSRNDGRFPNPDPRWNRWCKEEGEKLPLSRARDNGTSQSPIGILCQEVENRHICHLRGPGEGDIQPIAKIDEIVPVGIDIFGFCDEEFGRNIPYDNIIRHRRGTPDTL